MPNPSDVGLGWGGSQDYDSYNLWWATEASIDYGVAIQGRGRGDCGTNWTPTGTSVNGAEIFTENAQYDGTNQTALASIDRLSLQAPIDIRDMMIMSTNRFFAPFVVNSASDGSTLERLRIMIEDWSGVDAISTAGSSPNTILRFSVVSGGVNVFDFGFNQQLPCTNVIAFGADGDGFEGSGNVNPTINCFAFNNGANDYVNVVQTTCASEDTTGTLTGFTSTELVDFANNDFRTRATSTLATAGSGGTFIGAFLESSSSTPLNVDNITQAQTVSEPTLIQRNVLVVDGLTNEQSVSNVTLQVQINLDVDDLSSEQAVSNVTLQVQGVLDVNDLDNQQSISNVALTQRNILSVQSISNLQDVSNVELVVNYDIAPDDLQQSQNLSNVDLVVGDELIVQPLEQAQSLSNVELVQSHALITNPITQAQAIGNVVLNEEAGTEIITVAFKDDPVTVEYKLIEITVNYKD